LEGFIKSSILLSKKLLKGVYPKNKNKINKNFAKKIVSFLRFVKSKRRIKITKKKDKIYKGSNK
jgi:hypothetical protein